MTTISFPSEKIQDAINSVSNLTSTTDLLILSQMSSGGIFVDTANDLPNIVSSEIAEGQTILIADLNVMVYSANNQWLTFDGRVVRTDGPEITITPVITVLSAGFNGSGQFGNGTTISSCRPTDNISGFTDWCQASAGECHIVAVRQNGTLWAWGLNANGRLGDGTKTSRCSPVSVVGGFTNWCQVSAGGSHTAAVRTNGTLWTWGDGTSGRLGDGTTVAKSSPVSVVGGFTDWCQVAVGCTTTAAVRANGTLWTWGDNVAGQLGDNTTVNKSSPVSVAGVFNDWCQVATVGNRVAAIRTDGTLYTWGCGVCGQLGNNSTANRSSPGTTSGNLSNWCQVSVGPSHMVAVRTNGTLWGWGCTADNRIGDHFASNICSPVVVYPAIADWCQVSAGLAQTAGVRIKIN